QQAEPLHVFESREFMDGIEGEMNRRLGVLSLLYHQRRSSEAHPGMSVLDLEKKMNFPREYLHFTAWYLRTKGYITMADNSYSCLTAEGADYLEQHCPTNPLLQRLLLRGQTPANQGQAAGARL